jgi:beta-glucosidase
MTVDRNKFVGSEKIKVSISLKNNSDIAGKEVVQLYIRDLVSSTTRPTKELKDFKIISLRANETQIVTFEIDKKTLEFYSKNNVWETEDGDFQVFVGGSSDAVLKSDFTYKNRK